MSANENLKLTAEAWAEIVINIWMDKVQNKRKKKPYSSGDLLASLASDFAATIITNSGGDVERIIFAFKYYGKFVDMGVGRGVAIEDVEAKETKRRKKSWFSGTFDKQVDKLAELMEEKYGLKIASALVNSLDN